MTRYDHRTIEPKWQKKWQAAKIYQPDLQRAKNPFYNLMMFPYPSAEGLHVGNMYAFTGADIYGRFQRMHGHDVFEPIGLDGFGIHSENYAIRIKKHPATVAKITEKRFYEQLQSIGNGFSWNNRLETYDPDYYKWTQWIFIQLFKNGLAYRGKSKVNWCPFDKTVLADEQVIDGACERCGNKVEARELEQWFFKITAFADRLLENLEKIDWSEKVKTAQRNWIGKKQGAEVKFRISQAGDKNVIGEELWVFTTRPDTLFGATFLVLSPDHPFAHRIAVDEQQKTVNDYLADAKKSGVGNDSELKEKSGAFSGAFAINPATGQEVPIWIAKYVLAEYGTGAVMGVPAHDERDYDFAKRHRLPIVQVIAPYENGKQKLPYMGEGTLMHSGPFNGQPSNVARTNIVNELAKKNQAREKTTYRLRDWLISRQRYWGPPIPMVYCQDCGWVPVDEKNLPVLLPETDEYLPSQSGKTPLGRVDAFIKTACPKCGKPAARSDEVSDTFLDSAWYFLRYPSIRSTAAQDRPEQRRGATSSGQVPWDQEITQKWLPVTMYIGGAEHSVLHLLYSRFLTMALHDMGHLHFDEPFPKFRAHGLLVKKGAKISKSKGNVVVPDAYIKALGADTLRTYLMFLGPFDQGGNFQDKGIAGITRFLKRTWHLTHDAAKRKKTTDEDVVHRLHLTVRKVSNDLTLLKYNTAIASMMEFINIWEARREGVGADVAKVFLQLLAPFAPHMAEELWVEVLRETFSIHTSSWPVHDERAVEQKRVIIPITINGRVRDEIEVASDALEAEVVAQALKRDKVKLWVSQPKRTVYVPGRVLNIVTES